MDFPTDIQQKYELASSQEQQLRDLAMISDYLILSDKIRVHALTPRLFSELTGIKSPFIVGGDITPESVLNTLWIIKVKDKDETQEMFINSILYEYDFTNIVKEIEEYISVSFSDVISSSEGKVEEISYYSSFAFLVDYFASQYGWSEHTILNTPYTRLWQYMRASVKRLNPDKHLKNESHKILDNYLRSMYEKLE